VEFRILLSVGKDVNVTIYEVSQLQSVHWFPMFYPVVVGAQLCQLFPVYAHSVSLKPVMGK